MLALMLSPLCAMSQGPVLEEWQQKLIDNMFEYEGVYYSVLSEEKRTATVFDPHIFMFDSGGYYGDIIVAANPIKDGVEYSTVEVAPMCFYASHITSLELPNSILSITDAISGLSNLGKIVISENVESIVSSFMFLICPGLEEYTVPESVKILENSFNGITTLKKITLPSHPLALTADFYDAPLERIICKSTDPYPLYDSTFSLIDKSTCIVEVPKGCANAYKAADGWNEFRNIIESETNTIDNVSINRNYTDGQIYRLDGTKHKESDKGIFIRNGKKYINH